MNKCLSVLGLLVSCHVLGCSPVVDLTTEEMILKSEAIVIATVIGFGKMEDEDYALFEIDQKIKGGDTYRIGISKRIKGSEVSKNLDNRGQVPYQDSRRTRPGACNSQNYEFGSHYLLFLKDESPYWAAFRPVNEKVTGHQDPWVTWVKGFLTGSRLNMTEKSE
jgi:hypothetical protein